MPPIGPLFTPATISFKVSHDSCSPATSTTLLTVQPSFFIYAAVSILITLSLTFTLSLLATHLIAKSLFPSSASASRCQCTHCQPPTSEQSRAEHPRTHLSSLHLYRVTSPTRSSIRNSIRKHQSLHRSS